MKKLIYVLCILLMLSEVVYAIPPVPCKVKGNATAGYTLPNVNTIIFPGRSEIQARIDAITDESATNPYTIQLGAGTYNITTVITLPQYISLVGAGKDVTIVKYTGTGFAQGQLVQPIISAQGYQQIKGITFDGDKDVVAGAGAGGIQISGTSPEAMVQNIDIIDCKVKNLQGHCGGAACTTSGLEAGATAYIPIALARHGITVYFAHDIIIDKCTVVGGYDDGIGVGDYSYNVTLTNNCINKEELAWSPDSNGFEVDDGAHDVLFSNNTIYGIKYSAIQIKARAYAAGTPPAIYPTMPAYSITVANNIIYGRVWLYSSNINATTNALEKPYLEKISIVNNTINHPLNNVSTLSGLAVNYAQDCLIQANTFNGTSGLTVNGSNRVCINGNSFNDATYLVLTKGVCSNISCTNNTAYRTTLTIGQDGVRVSDSANIQGVATDIVVTGNNFKWDGAAVSSAFAATVNVGEYFIKVTDANSKNFRLGSYVKLYEAAVTDEYHFVVAITHPDDSGNATIFLDSAVAYARTTAGYAIFAQQYWGLVYGAAGTAYGTIVNLNMSNNSFSGAATAVATASWQHITGLKMQDNIPPVTLTQTLTGVSGTILNNAEEIIAVGDADYTLTSTPTIANGGYIGEQMVIMGSGANNLTLQDQATLAGSNLLLGATTRELSAGAILRLRWDGTDWQEVQYIVKPAP